MTTHELRKRFLEYFKKNGHRIIPTSSLIPSNDPSLLFTNAGMVQFKEVFLGREKREYVRAATAQKCLRAGGKHNDLDNVGYTSRHHTFFEMLGNFSFGDYFKEEAISLSWEFLIENLSLPSFKLWVTIFAEDEESFYIWRDRIGIPEERIVKMGEKDNFWAMGDSGPCGPCSEIVIDQGEEIGCKSHKCQVGCECDRFLELWNLVFMQYNRNEQKELTPLPQPSIDTGMGLERLAAVIQGVKSNYETDLFFPLIRYIEEISGKSYGEEEKENISLRVIADHSRAITFLISEGVLPSNEGRGYVLRRIMRRAARHGKRLGLEKPFLYKTIGVVIDLMKEAYPELKEAQNYLARVALNEEERFSETLKMGLNILNEEMERLKKKEVREIPGKLLFKLYDTFGFPLDLTYDIVREEGFKIDEEGFQGEMEEQKKKARESWKGFAEAGIKESYLKLANQGVKTVFMGYEHLETASPVLKILYQDKEVEEGQKGQLVELITEKTPFYGESGGQVGDQGLIETETMTMGVEDTLRPLPDLILHRGTIKKGEVKEGEEVKLKVDKEKRQATALNHTCTHILHAVLKEVLGEHVKQAGSLVTPERFRFDFTHFLPLEERELTKIEVLVNQKIRENSLVEIEIVPFKEALKKGATALFGEKYGEKVRMVKLSDYSLELCGGTHVRRTGEIGLFKLISEGGVAAGVRRIEALTGEEAFQYLRREEEELKEIGLLLKAQSGEIVEKFLKFQAQQKTLEKEIESLKGRLLKKESGQFLEHIREISGVKVLSAEVEVKDPKTLRDFADQLKEQIKSGIVILGAKEEDKVMLVTVVSKDLIPKFDAGKIIAEVAKIVEGKGGGRADMAQAGGKKVEKLKEALDKAFDIIEGWV